jgi:hypothetical protein
MRPSVPGCQREEELARRKWGGIKISPNGVYRVLKRHGLETAKKRLARIAGFAAPPAPEPKEPEEERHLGVDHPGELVQFDCFYIGRLVGADAFVTTSGRSGLPAGPERAPGGLQMGASPTGPGASSCALLRYAGRARILVPSPGSTGCWLEPGESRAHLVGLWAISLRCCTQVALTAFSRHAWCRHSQALAL